jgi:hypothetical protein
MPNLAPFADFAGLVSATRAARAASVTPSPFKANSGGPFIRPRSFDPGSPSTRAIDAASDSVERSKRDAAAIRASYARFDSSLTGAHPRSLNGGRFSTAR